MCVTSRKALMKELARFFFVGVLNTVLCLGIIYSIKWGMQWGDVSANLVGYLVCIPLGLIFNSYWTFGQSNIKPQYLLGYLLVMAVAYLMNLSTVLFLIATGMPGDFAQLAGVPIFTLTSFLLIKLILIKKFPIHGVLGVLENSFGKRG